jgi:hypothetical protein
MATPFSSAENYPAFEIGRLLPSATPQVLRERFLYRGELPAANPASVLVGENPDSALP